MESKRTEVDKKKTCAYIENNKNILFCTGIFWVGQMHYGPPNEIFEWATSGPPKIPCGAPHGLKRGKTAVADPGGLPGRGPPMAGREKFFSLVPILNRYARPGLTILNSKFHRISRFEQCNFGQFLSKVNSFL
jgi:hypothetical protein